MRNARGKLELVEIRNGVVAADDHGLCASESDPVGPRESESGMEDMAFLVNEVKKIRSDLDAAKEKANSTGYSWERNGKCLSGINKINILSPTPVAIHALLSDAAPRGIPRGISRGTSIAQQPQPTPLSPSAQKSPA